MLCYISKSYKNVSDAGNKAKTDIEEVMSGRGYKNIGLRRTVGKGTVARYFLTLAGVAKAHFSLHRGDILVLQYPLKKYYNYLVRLAHWKGARVITLIHDLESFRLHKISPGREMRWMNRSDYIIAHNTSMRRWMSEHGCTARIGTLEIFDYLANDRPVSSGSAGGSAAEEGAGSGGLEVRGAADSDAVRYWILYAGALNMRKNPFLYKMDPYVRRVGLSLYGGGFEIDKISDSSHFLYHGFMPSDRLIREHKGDFGLVWDGPDLDACTGDFGDYLRYNNPHKTSLYLRCGLPVLIWDRAALAPFVREHGAGLCISSLKELDGRLASLSRDEYEQMKRRAEEIRDRLAAGYYCSRALAEAVKMLSED